MQLLGKENSEIGMKNKMQVLQINADNFKRGGVSQVIWRYMENLTGETQFSFLTYRNDVSEDVLEELKTYGAQRICIKKVPNKYFHFFAKYFQVVKVLKKGAFDFVHVNADNMIGASLYILACKRCKTKIILQGHTTAFSTGNETIVKMKSAVCSLLQKVLLGSVNIKLAVSTSAAQFMYGRKQEDVTILPNGLDPDKYRYDELKRVLLRRQMGAGNKIIVGHIGRFCYAKNHSFMLQIFGEAAKRQDNIELWLVGNGDLEDETKEQVKQLGLSEKVKFMGTTQDVQAYLSAFDIFLFPSRYEGFPLVLLEAQMCDLPVLVSDVVSVEAIFLKNVTRISLRDTAETWSNALINEIDFRERADRSEDLKNAGLSIQDISRRYLELLQTGGEKNK